jgi:hypothetical protein
MSISALKRLPLEALMEICEHINHTYKPSVLSFVLISKKLYHTAISFIFHTITIDVKDQEQLFNKVELLWPKIRKHIRHLVIKGLMPVRVQAEGKDSDDNDTWKEIMRKREEVSTEVKDKRKE